MEYEEVGGDEWMCVCVYVCVCVCVCVMVCVWRCGVCVGCVCVCFRGTDMDRTHNVCVLGGWGQDRISRGDGWYP